MEITPCHLHVFLSWFKVGREKVKDESRDLRPSTGRNEINVERVAKVLLSDRWLTVQMIVSQLDMKKECIWKIIKGDMSMWKAWAKKVSKAAE